MTDAARKRGAPDRSRAPVGDSGSGGRAPQDSVGEYFARQRKLREVSIGDLCARTKIPRRNIERLESGALDEQSDAFTRGLVRTLAEALGLDADEAVMRLLREPPVDERATSRGAGGVPLYWIGAAIAGLALVLLLLRGLYVWWVAEDAPVDPRHLSGVTYRSDVVRSLARERAPADPGGAAPAGPDAPPPAEPAEAP